MSAHKRLVTIGILLAVLGLSGCSDDESAQPSGDAASQDAGTDTKAGGKGKGNKGNKGASPAQQVPKDFPSAVPLLDGRVLGSSSEQGSWSVMVEVDGQFAAVSQRAVSRVLEAGFAEQERSAATDYLTVTSANGEYDVAVTVSAAAGANTVFYAVNAS
jgi:hypothetical protein